MILIKRADGKFEHMAAWADENFQSVPLGPGETAYLVEIDGVRVGDDEKQQEETILTILADGPVGRTWLYEQVPEAAARRLLKAGRICHTDEGKCFALVRTGPRISRPE